MATDQQADWVRRVLGIQTGPEGAADAGRQAADLLAAFQDAKDDVDAGLTRLQGALRATEDEDLVRIADLGLFGMTNGAGVGLVKALFDLRDAAPGGREARVKAARDAASRYKEAVFGHVMADMVDDNPFGVSVGVKAKLGPALDAIARIG